MKTTRTNTSHTASQITAGVACAIGLFIGSTAYAQQYDMRNASDDVNQSFNFIEAWGVMPFEGESAMALIPNESTCTMAENGLSCTEYRVGLSLYNDGDVTPSFENYGTLSDVYVRDLPLEFSYSEHDLADLGIAYPEGPLNGAAYFQEGLIVGILTTPTGYEMAVSGTVLLNIFDITSPEEIIVDSVLFYPSKQWYSMDAAIDTVDQQADALWSFVTEEQNSEHNSGEINPRILFGPHDCYMKYLADLRDCANAYSTNLENAENALNDCLDDVGFWDVVGGGAAGAGAGGAVAAGGVATWTWWMGPIGGVTTGAAGAIGGLVGGIGGAFYGPAHAREACRSTASTARETHKNNFELCKTTAWNKLLDCLFGG